MKIYVVALAMVSSVHALCKKVQRHDPDLARQMRRASASVPLNMAEGWHAQAGHRTERLGTAMREARETSACLDVCRACGYLATGEIAVDLDRLDHIVATLWRTHQAAQVERRRLRGRDPAARGSITPSACATASTARR